MADPIANLHLRLLVIRCQAGDRAAIEDLIRAHDPRLRLFLHKMLPSRADDLAQDVWLDVLRDLPELEDPAAFAPWLYRIARNRAYRVLRLRTPPPASLEAVDLPADGFADDDFTPDDAAAVHAALDQLPPEHREVLLLRFIESMSYDDIAAACGVPLGTVRSRLHNAKRSLRSILERQGVHP